MWPTNEITIAFMMSEIDMAQRRLFDDDAPHTGQQIPSTATVPFTESELRYIDQQQQQQGLQGVDSTLGCPEECPQVQMPVLHPEWYNSDRNQWVENALAVGAAHSSISTFDRTQSNLSSNAYESAPEGPTNADAAMHETIQTEVLNKNPIRSKSLQEAALDFPHGTEPFSSLRSPNVSRSKSDATARRSAPQQPQANATDELCPPVSVEIPVIQKKKAPKKKKSQPQLKNDDDDELAVPSDSKNNNPKAKEVSRTRSNKQTMHSSNLNETHQPIETNIPHPISNEPKQLNDKPHTTNPDDDRMHLIQLNAPQTQTQHPEPSKHEPSPHSTEPPNPKQPRKEPKKKKLKRGKTTSVTLLKTYEPDVEDDVIWIDDRQHDPQHDRRPDSIPTPDSISTPAGEQETFAAVEIPMIGKDQEKGNPDQEPAPRRRGRKRKNTSEQPPVSVEEEPTEANEHAPGQPLSNVSVVVEKPANGDKQKSTPPTIDKMQLSAPALAPEAGPEPELEHESTSNAPVTPKKSNPTPDTSNQGQCAAGTSTKSNNDNKGPSKHSPIASTSKVPYRVGLSRRARIAPLLKVIRK